MGEVKYSVALAEATRKMLDNEEISYEFEEEGIFRFSLKLDEGQKLQSMRITVRIYEDALSSYGLVNMKADQASLGAVVEYFTRANYGMRLGNFEVDYRDGTVRFKFHNRFENQIPSEEELLNMAVGFPAFAWKRYGNGFLKVLFGGMNPEKAIEEAEGDQNGAFSVGID